jgi:hypothetical protein
MAELRINLCLACLGNPETRTFGVSGRDGSSQTAIIECACGRVMERTSIEECDAMPAAVAAWNTANPE